MPTIKEVRNQVEKITSELIGLSMCDHQNFPALRELNNGLKEIGLKQGCNLSIALKNMPYKEIYDELNRTQSYNIRMLDGALIQIMYEFKDELIRTHHLAFFPSPYLEEFQNNPDVYLEDEIYSEVVMKSLVPFPIRFDYDSNDAVVKDVDHPMSHLTLGQYRNCRIPVGAPLTPYYFISFILRNFYHTAYEKYCDGITEFVEGFSETITDNEKQVLHLTVPFIKHGIFRRLSNKIRGS